MRLRHSFTFVAALALVVPTVVPSQALAQDASVAVAGGGITAAGWTGKVDAGEAKAGQTIDNSKFASEGDTIHVVTGPAANYWKADNTATGDYTIKATFTEPKFQGLNGHAHPYGIFIGGNDLGTDTQSLLYCSAYGNGNFIVRGFGPAAFAMNGRRGGANDAVNKAAAVGEPVTQEIALSVTGDTVACAINGTVVASYSKAELVGEGKLKSTDGHYGVRFGHNTEAIIKGFGKQ
ncbi:MAG: hypothetical protein HQ485_12825 [Acidobacteria bacterium]|jgi:hypothetical protein|nr:hypothetical protein [Acidobacteriota bacterium]